MANATDVILQLSDKQWSSAQQAESRFASLTNVTLLGSTVLQGFIIMRGFDAPALLAAIVMVVLGSYGVWAGRQYSRRFRLGVERVEELTRRFDELHPDLDPAVFGIGSAGDRASHFRVPTLLHAGLITVGLVNLAMITLS